MFQTSTKQTHIKAPFQPNKSELFCDQIANSPLILPVTFDCIISGARYSGVPHRVHVRSWIFLAKPKSVILRWPSRSSNRFSGFMSLEIEKEIKKEIKKETKSEIRKEIKKVINVGVKKEMKKEIKKK